MSNIEHPYYSTVPSPIGELFVAGDGESLGILYMNDANDYSHAYDGRTLDKQALQPVADQLDAYFAGERQDFDIKLNPAGTPFQRSVWNALTEIPYGETRTYGEIAAAVGQPQAARAVGTANNRNPIAVIVPCHRVIGANGSLVGYAGGLGRKEKLLELESGVMTL
jgi:methylated-DNA-[protein]-cysteine S-methyltransferase